MSKQQHPNGRMTVVFYTATCYLDISLEVINVLKKIVDLHVLIEITEGSKKQNIVQVERLPEKALAHPHDLLPPAEWAGYRPYFEGVASVAFAVHAQKRGLTSLKTSYGLFRFIRRVKPDVLHLEAMMVRALGLVPSLFYTRKLVISIHDPVPHSGERDRKQALAQRLFFGLPVNKSFLFYSDYAKGEFENHYPVRGAKAVLKMAGYSYFRKLLQVPQSRGEHILFFGRLSPYKGIETLLEAMNAVFESFPHETLVIAGKGYKGYEIDPALLTRCKGDVRILDRYIPNEEVAALISGSKFVVCPYTDATQSGVLMTAFALNKPVVASAVGAFSEYIREGENGWLTPAKDAARLAESIKAALHKERYKEVECRIAAENERSPWEVNAPVLLKAYAH